MPNTVLSGNPTGAVEDYQDSAYKVGNPQIFNTPTPATYTGATTQTLTANDILGSLIVVAGTAGNSAVTITTPTAALLAAGMRAFSSRGVVVGDGIWVLIINGNSGANSITLAAGTGGTFEATAASRTIGQNSSKELVLRFTNGTPGAEAYTIYF